MVYTDILQREIETWFNMYDTSAAVHTPVRFALYIKIKKNFFS